LAGPGWRLVPQADGDLGVRMRHYFQAALDGGFRRVVLIGSDSPTLPVQRVHEAFEALDDVSVVLGPSSDGGYYLLGLAERIPKADIFVQMMWGTATVCSRTVSRLTAARIPFSCLPEWYDVDDQGTLDRLRNDLTGQPSEPALCRLREALA
jgi:rSAM/selenodomain-associated transferase 1